MICGAIRPPNDHDNDLGDQKISRNLFGKCLGRDRTLFEESKARNTCVPRFFIQKNEEKLPKL